ncbi:MAG: AAA family ATPase [Wolbachia endosymbiont of Fragariocoptes setiger]|nr:AAA family ATPase [Wolbachia endosymbiont of Fragariocoptes setiger]
MSKTISTSKKLIIAIFCIFLIISLAFLLSYLQTILLSQGFVLAANCIEESFPITLTISTLFVAWFVIEQVINKSKEVPLQCEIELADSDNKRTTFDDIVISDSLKKKLQMYLCDKMDKNEREGMSKLKIDIPSGFIFHGPPGNGKTFIARAIAGESNVNFISVSGSDLIGRYIGHGASTVHKLFKLARKHSPCIVFIDEIDSVGSDRNRESNYYFRESLTQLLAEIDGFKKNNKGIKVIAATNNFRSIDPALIRPGRLGEHVYIENPNLDMRIEALKFYTKDLRLSSTDIITKVAKETEGFSFAQLKDLVNEAKFNSLAKNSKENILTMSDMMDALKAEESEGLININSSSDLSGILTKIRINPMIRHHVKLITNEKIVSIIKEEFAKVVNLDAVINVKEIQAEIQAIVPKDLIRTC